MLVTARMPAPLDSPSNSHEFHVAQPLNPLLLYTPHAPVAGRRAQTTLNNLITTTYGYDGNGNRTQVNGQTVADYDAQDRLIAYDGRRYDYDAHGDLRRKTAGQAVTDYRYDLFGNLKHVTLPNGQRIDYQVDGQQRRIGKTINNMRVQSWLYQDALRPIAELDGNGQVVARFIYADKSNVPAYLIKNGQRYRILSDHLGSPRWIVNSADGTVAQQMALNYRFFVQSNGVTSHVGTLSKEFSPKMARSVRFCHSRNAHEKMLFSYYRDFNGLSCVKHCECSTKPV